jgi:hypothetical protein
MLPRAHALKVPMVADSVDSPRLIYGRVGPLAGNAHRNPDALYFPLRYPEPGEGRVTFEGLDSVRVCRGEYMPYEEAGPFARGDWVYEVSDSPWLTERDAYEAGHYETPLIGSYRHFLFTFHDEFVEAIALGIWFDRPDPADPLSTALDHPLARLDGRAPAQSRRSPSGIVWELLRSPKDEDALIEDSKLCSQRLYQFNLVLDGESSESASVWLRTLDGRTTSRLALMWVGEVARRDGLVMAEDFFDAWEDYVAQVAERRRAMGKPMA